MTRARRLLVIALCASAVAVGAVTGMMAWWQDVAAQSRRAEAVRLGDSEADVVRAVGAPDLIQTPPDHLWCARAGVAKEYLYGTALLASWDVIGFDAAGRVICKLELQSP